MRRARGIGNQPRVAGEIADRGIDLRQRDADRGHVDSERRMNQRRAIRDGTVGESVPNDYV
ncbi:MAG TPA: hypothetical protein VF107_04585, partial [Burkholderiaceae bacterium]